MNKKVIIAASIAFLLISSTADALLYKWKDKDGIPHMTNSFDKVPLEYRDQVTEEEEGDPQNISISDKPETTRNRTTAPPKPYPKLIENSETLYDRKPLTWWIAQIDSYKTSIETTKLTIETLELRLDSHKSSLNYSSDLSRQLRDLNAQLRSEMGRRTESPEEEQAKRLNIVQLKKEIKRVRARKNANSSLGDEKKDAVKSIEDEIEQKKEELAGFEAALAEHLDKARRAGVPQRDLP